MVSGFLTRVCASEEVAGCCLWTDVVATTARISGQSLWRSSLSVVLLSDHRRSTRLCMRREKKKALARAPHGPLLVGCGWACCVVCWFQLTRKTQPFALHGTPHPRPSISSKKKKKFSSRNPGERTTRDRNESHGVECIRPARPMEKV